MKWAEVFKAVSEVAKDLAKKSGKTYKEVLPQAWKDPKIVALRSKYDAQKKDDPASKSVKKPKRGGSEGKPAVRRRSRSRSVSRVKKPVVKRTIRRRSRSRSVSRAKSAVKRTVKRRSRSRSVSRRKSAVKPAVRRIVRRKSAVKPAVKRRSRSRSRSVHRVKPAVRRTVRRRSASKPRRSA